MICGPCQAGDHSNHHEELADVCIGCSCTRTQPCGCPIGQGHVCRPPWMTIEEWTK